MAGVSLSSVWETRPMIVEDQPLFLNMVVSGSYSGTADELLVRLHAVEEQLGRDRSQEVPKGPRTMDLDILLFGDLNLQDEHLTVPHPGIRERAFVLEPLLELLPPGFPPRKEYSKALEKNADQGVECYIERSHVKNVFKGAEEKGIE